MSDTITRRVLVMLSFSSDIRDAQRDRIITFWRIKHLIEQKCEVFTKLPDATHASDVHYEANLDSENSGAFSKVKDVRVTYEVNVLLESSGTLQENLRRIIECDILIVVLHAFNPNVLYELTARHMLRGGLVTIVKDNQSLPDYFRNELYIDWNNDTDKNIEIEIDKYLRETGERIDFNRPPPAHILDLILGDQMFGNRLENALAIWEGGRKRAPHLSELLNFVAPGEIISNWVTLFPIQIVQITWKRQSGPGFYLPEDVLRGPLVCWANRLFLDMFGLAEVSNPLGLKPLTAQVLVDRIEALEIVDQRDLRKFIDEQSTLMEAVFFKLMGEPARVPLRFNDRAHMSVRNRELLPTIVGRNSVGPKNSTHDMYVAVIFVPVQGGTAQ